METLRLRPHHLLDIIKSHGAGTAPGGKHRWGASVPEVTERVLADIDQEAIMVSQVDSICATCSMLQGGICQARLGEELLMREYNDPLDASLFAYLGLQEGQRITIRDFLRLVNRDVHGVVDLFSRGDAAARLQATERALDDLGIR